MKTKEKERAPVLVSYLCTKYLEAVAEDWRLTASVVLAGAVVVLVVVEVLVVFNILSLVDVLETAQ